jgi:hypothetical protein
MQELTSPNRLYSRIEILDKNCPIPKSRGLYAWFFKSIPPLVPIENCIVKDGLTLLYAGISPKDENSNENLRKRIRTHYNGNAEGSTLRLTLGVLLEKSSNHELRRVGSGKRMTFTHLGEQWLDNWMQDNAYVCWLENNKPWEIEREIFKSFSLPLNIKDNDHHKFSKTLSKLRSKSKKNAREMPIANEDNLQRKV